MEDMVTAFFMRRGLICGCCIKLLTDIKYQRLIDKVEFDSIGRAVVNIRWIVEKGGQANNQ